MKISRREFLKLLGLCVLSGPSILSENSPKIKIDNNNLLNYASENIKKIWDLTTLKYKYSPQLSIVERIGIPLKLQNGEYFTIRNELVKFKPLGDSPKTLTFFAHLTDAHILDEESPARVVAAEPYLELIGVDSAFRPQEDLTSYVLDAMFKTLDNINNRATFDFLLNTGDSTDNAQENELKWFLENLEGEYVDPDSGINEDPVPGPNNDGNDPFKAHGFPLNIPYYTAIGNHDVLLQGTVPPDLRELYNAIIGKFLKILKINDPVGDYSNAVITPWAEPPDPSKLKPGYIIPDPRRKVLNGKDFINYHLKYRSKRKFLGFPNNLFNKDYAYYTFYPKNGLPMKFIVLDTTCRLGTHLGTLDKIQYEEFLIPELEKAKRDKELVVIVSHHPAEEILGIKEIKDRINKVYGKNEELRKLLKELFGRMGDDKDYIRKNEFEELLKRYDNVFLHVAGHLHENKITLKGNSNRGYWEVQTASLISYPQQTRLFEIVYEGDCIGAIHTCVVDHQSPPDSLAYKSRYLAYLDANKNKNLRKKILNSKKEDRNTILRFNIPPEIAKKL